ncbi:hypothetical protein LO763_21910 [Glycomyces sp. A-F 0318]|uniref:DddA-like double-stranded DNA deaminase toxin n=1 Tax=Glycomyces amatae TaxID=2881355 RepID=UPI001E4A8D19|nr:hypothetical protein [Glycomyces amatae]
MSTLSDLVARLRGLIEGTKEASTALKTAHDQVERATAALQATTVGSSNPLVAEGLGQLQTVRQQIEEAQMLLNAGNGTMEQYVQGRLGNGGSDGTPTGKPPDTAAPAVTPHGRRELGSIGPSEGMAGLRPFDEAKTALGNLFFSSGKQNVQPLKATPGTTKFEPGEVKPGWQGTKPAQGHIEGNVAADMLHTGEMKGVLFLNVEPCDHGGTGCKSNTAHYLKPGVELQVKVYEGTRLKYRKRITGTGEALTGE